MLAEPDALHGFHDNHICLSFVVTIANTIAKIMVSSVMTLCKKDLQVESCENVALCLNQSTYTYKPTALIGISYMKP